MTRLSLLILGLALGACQSPTDRISANVNAQIKAGTYKSSWDREKEQRQFVAVEQHTMGPDGPNLNAFGGAGTATDFMDIGVSMCRANVAGNRENYSKAQLTAFRHKCYDLYTAEARAGGEHWQEMLEKASDPLPTASSSIYVITTRGY